MTDNKCSPNRDRPAKNPGGMQCERCDEIFIGEEWHALCGICVQKTADEIAAAQRPSPETVEAIAEKMQQHWQGGGHAYTRPWDNGTDKDCVHGLPGQAEFFRQLARIAISDLAQGSWQPMSALPDIGRKFICLYSDGSGAVMFWRHNDGYIDQDGDDCHFERGQYDRWAYLPDELEFWCETRGEDPMCLTLPSTDREGK